MISYYRIFQTYLGIWLQNLTLLFGIEEISVLFALSDYICLQILPDDFCIGFFQGHFTFKRVLDVEAKLFILTLQQSPFLFFLFQHLVENGKWTGHLRQTLRVGNLKFILFLLGVVWRPRLVWFRLFIRLCPVGLVNLVHPKLCYVCSYEVATLNLDFSSWTLLIEMVDSDAVILI